MSFDRGRRGRGKDKRDGFGDPHFDTYSDFGGGGGGFRGGGDRGGFGGDRGRGGFGSFGGRGGMGGGRGGGGYNAAFSGGGSRYGGARKNELGFHGSMHDDPILERELYKGQSSTGINFDKVCAPCRLIRGVSSVLNAILLCVSCLQYDAIPVEVSGDDVPEPLLEFDASIVGEAVSRNLALCGYTKPTPVQKYSVPIGTHVGTSSFAVAFSS